jgi:membrane-associated phospholipid phosphatase
VLGTACAISLAVVLQSQAPERQQPLEQAPPPAVSEQWTDDRPFTRLFPNLARDFRSLATMNSALIASAGGAGAVATHRVDTRLAGWSARTGEPSYTIAGRVLGDGWVQSGGAVATYAIGKLARKPQLVHVGGDLIRAQALNGVITTVLKVAVDRTRPSGGPRAFPSGHTSATFASSATLHAHYGWKVGGPAFAAAGFVAWTRARDGVHWLSDVAFGSAVGIVAGRAVAAQHAPKRLAIVPVPTRGGSAIFVTWQLQPRN